MMTSFYAIGTVLQTGLLVLSLLTVIELAVANMIRFRNSVKLNRRAAFSAALLAGNAALYVLMQIDCRTADIGGGFALRIPYGILLGITLVSLLCGVYIMLNVTRNRTTINNSSIKEAFDNLPTGVCFFSEDGVPVLCNLAMHRFSFAVCGRDIQHISDLEMCRRWDFEPQEGVRKDGKLFQQKSGTVWQLEKRTFQYEGSACYTQFVALDVTDLYQNQVELARENAALRKMQSNLRQLSANVVALTREEEVLNAKMRIHDEMGRCLTAAQQYLKADAADIPNSLAVSWQKATAVLKNNSDAPDEDMLLQIRKTCEILKIRFVETGSLPAAEDAAYLLTCAVRECVTNAVRYADATELSAVFRETDDTATVTITNNGKPPREAVREGGGLSTLRCRVERAGGTMTIQSFPVFELTVTVPKGKEGYAV